ncbi:MAG TPA: hypothetical protein VHD83_16225 [Puia sp.]|nr:hypothetical protein [Puia sp.]
MKNKPLLLLLAILIFSGCRRTVPGDRSAKGSLENDKGNCLPATIKGKWYSGVAPDADTNYVEVSVNVTKTGNYRIVSDVENGVEFADSGIFSATGLQTVRLKAHGVFTGAGSISFTISFDNSQCGFSVDVGDLPLADNSWRFTARGHIYSGPCGSQQYYLPNALGSILDIAGPVASGEDTLLFIEVAMPPDGYGPVLGTYNTSTTSGYFDFYEEKEANIPGHQIFLASSDRPDKVVTIVLSSFGTAKDGSRMTLGTFDGIAIDSTGADVTISNGAFRVGGVPYPFHF